MKIKYFNDTDTALIEFTDKQVEETREISENIYIDLDAVMRNYEKDGTFPKPIITDKGYRLYSEEDVTKLQAYFLPAKHRRKPKI